MLIKISGTVSLSHLVEEKTFGMGLVVNMFVVNKFSVAGETQYFWMGAHVTNTATSPNTHIQTSESKLIKIHRQI